MTPPRVARALVWAAAPAAERADVLADLAEEARAHASRRGVRFARRWYWRQALRSVAPLTRRRLTLGSARLRVVLTARDAGRESRMGGAMSDARFAIRYLARRPLVTTVAIATLAIGIGATTAMFSVVDGVLWRALP